MNNIQINCHSSIKITSEDKTMYFDPFKIKEKVSDADIIFITHDHFDHFEPESINNICHNNTQIVMPEQMKDMIKQIEIPEENLILVAPNNKYTVCDVEFETIPSYNVNKQFHPKDKNWVGYVVTLNDEKYYIAGDTDITEENQQVNADVALVPIGGTYTMTKEEAAKLINIIKPKVAIPTHYGEIVGNKEDGIVFREMLNPDIECQILIK